jgi:hypothetical protein
MLIVLNELKNCGEEPSANFDSLKSLITDEPLRVNKKINLDEMLRAYLLSYSIPITHSRYRLSLVIEGISY